MDYTTLQAVDFHGHLCAGLTMGIRAARLALREIGPHAADEEVDQIFGAFFDAEARDWPKLATRCPGVSWLANA